MSQQRNILLLFAHPSMERSEVNRPMFERALQIPGVTAIDLYAQYPTYDIDIDLEQQRLLAHDVVLFMFPLYWYSTPSLLKEWMDLVLEYGFAYGPEGHALHGKIAMCALTAGGAELAYRAEGYNHYPLPELLRPIQQAFTMCGMHYLPPFALFQARTARKEGRISEHLALWQQLLELLRDSPSIDFSAAAPLPKINDSLPTVFGGQA